jgi:hypothetical protein
MYPSVWILTILIIDKSSPLKSQGEGTRKAGLRFESRQGGRDRRKTPFRVRVTVRNRAPDVPDDVRDEFLDLTLLEIYET